MLVIGQKVVCIDDTFTDVVRKLYRNLPVKNVVYTIRQVSVGRGNIFAKDNGKMDGEIKVLLVELINDLDPALKIGIYDELGFKAERFAPLQTLPDEKNQEGQGEETWEEIERRRYEHQPEFEPVVIVE